MLSVGKKKSTPEGRKQQPKQWQPKVTYLRVYSQVGHTGTEPQTPQERCPRTLPWTHTVAFQGWDNLVLFVTQKHNQHINLISAIT